LLRSNRRVLDKILEFVWIYGDSDGWVKVESEIEGRTCELADGEEGG